MAHQLLSVKQGIAHRVTIFLSRRSLRSLKADALQGKQLSLEWTETSRGLWEWWHDPANYN